MTQLLRLGPLSLSECVDITGWPYASVRQTVSYLRDKGTIQFNQETGGYAVTQ